MNDSGKYLIVLFKNKKRKKIINRFKTIERAKRFYNDFLKKNEVIFKKSVENGKPCHYEISLLGITTENKNKFTVRDSLGRLINAEVDSNYSIVNLDPYDIEEEFYDVSKKKKITFLDFSKVYLSGSGLKMVSKLNNKVVVQNDDKCSLFSFKCESESSRFLDVLTSYNIDNNKSDVLIVPDTSKEQKKYLYETLEEKGFKKSSLYRRFTTYSKSIN